MKILSQEATANVTALTIGPQRTKTEFFKLFLFPKGRFTVLNIAFLGILLGLDLVISRFVKIPIPLFTIRFDHIWPIIVPLIYGFGLGLFFNLIADALNQLIAGSIGFYMWQYMLSMVFITLIVSAMRMVFYLKDRPHFNTGVYIFNNTFILAIAGLLVGLLVMYNQGVTVPSKNATTGDIVAKVLSYNQAFFWTGIGLTIAVTLAALVVTNWKYRKLKFRTDAYSAVYVLAIVFAVTVLVDVIWEGYAYKEYLWYVRKSNVSTYPYFYFLATRIPEKILIGTVSYVIVEAVYNVARFIIKDKNERLTY